MHLAYASISSSLIKIWTIPPLLSTAETLVRYSVVHSGPWA